MKNEIVTKNNWDFLKTFTDARISLGRVGTSLPTNHLLDFQLSHAQVKDAVNSEIDFLLLNEKLNKLISSPIFLLQSKANSKEEYLKRPDFGRRLNESSKIELNNSQFIENQISIVIGDGLSPKAIETHAIPFLELFLMLLEEANLIVNGVSLVKYCRVATGDEIGELSKSSVVIVLIGERPGLSSIESMGIYMTYKPKIGLTDESRNCISNIRTGGLSYKHAALKLFHLLTKSLELKSSGIILKDDLILPS